MSFVCDTCKKLFTTKQSLEYHTKRNVCCPKIKEEINCILCHKLFSTKQKLEYHIKNKVCLELIEKDDLTLKMHQMYELIRNLQAQVLTLEKENITLKDQLKTFESENIKNGKVDTTSEEEKYKRLRAMHIKSADKADKCKTIFYDDHIHYAMIPTQTSSSNTIMSIFAMIDIDHNYHPIISADISRIHRIFKSFDLSDTNSKIRVNLNIFDKCIQHLGINNEDNIEPSKNSNKNSNKSSQTTSPNIEEFFQRNEDGTEYFIGTTLKRCSMESFKEIYKDEGENTLLEEAPQRFLDLWEKSNGIILRYFNI